MMMEAPGRMPVESPTAMAIFVNYTGPNGKVGSIRVTEATCCTAVARAKILGTDIWIRAIDQHGHTLDRVRVRA